MSHPRPLPAEEFLALIKNYQENHPENSAIEALEAEIEQKAYERLAPEWQNGWDFCTTTGFFGARGVSILIQNTQIGWQQLWDWLITEYPTIPEGAMINFEVWNSIREGKLTGGDMLVRRLILSNGVYTEQSSLESGPGE